MEQLSNHYAACEQYREPFFGGGSIGLAVLSKGKMTDFWVNDKDVAMRCLWQSVAQFSQSFIRRVQRFTPSVVQFDEFRASLAQQPLSPMSEAEIVETGFRKLAVHQMSFSGLGEKSGGPLGGREQDEHTKYAIDCRWSPQSICKKVTHYSYLMNNTKFKVTDLDFIDLIECDALKALIYLDPPYFDKGADLYIHSFDQADHERLADALKNTNHKWILSYDDCLEVRKLYEWAHIEQFAGTYTIKQTKGTKSDPDWLVKQKTELLIMPHNMKIERHNFDEIFGLLL